MRFVYIGGLDFDETPLPDEATICGIVFPLNVPTALPDSVRNAEHVRNKLCNHPHFRTVGDPMEAVAPLSDEEVTQLVENVLATPAPKRRGRPPKLPTIIEEDY